MSFPNPLSASEQSRRPGTFRSIITIDFDYFSLPLSQTEVLPNYSNAVIERPNRRKKKIMVVNVAGMGRV